MQIRNFILCIHVCSLKWLLLRKKKVKLLLDTSSVSWRKRSHGSSRGCQNWALCVSQMAFHIFSSLLVRSAVFPICTIPQALRANNLVYLLYFPSCFSLILQWLERRWTKISSSLPPLVCFSPPWCIPESWIQDASSLAQVDCRHRSNRALFFFTGRWEETCQHTLCDMFSVNVTYQNCVME